MNDFLTNDINIEIIKYIQTFSNSFLDKFAEGITMMGEQYFFIMIIAIIFWCVDKKFGYRLGFTLISSMVINGAIKEILKVPRIFGTEGIRSLRINTATGYSFPSGHTQGVATFWMSIISNVKKKYIYFLGSIIVILVAVSRIYLGVHRPIDVIGGIVISLIWVLVCNIIFNYLDNGGNKLILFSIIVPMLIGLFMFKTHDYYTISGVTLGFFVGYNIESQYIKFNEKTSMIINIFKFLVGVSIVLIIMKGLKLVFPKYLLFDFIRYCIIGIWMTSGAPYLFKKIGFA
ncbi:phosphatase PAP2 family protein [Clostridium aestuarii]|uniref:Phosphatase PAP2 family protein n=1 Tax=Clostridium aestuarii TaxID=338193 RepID=A0ABT4D1Q7_9CLOT|nr:phosphatase PAP2 family protein [Clostridium aestuarii]MCY6485178.1 phosphatase PAP2 family protein [Clostridium aestuarii]